MPAPGGLWYTRDMQRLVRLTVALLLALPQAATAAAVIRGKAAPAPIVPLVPALGLAPAASLSAPSLRPSAPSLNATPLSAPALSAPSLQAPAAAAAPKVEAAAPRSEISAALPASAVPAAEAAAAPEAANPGKTALERLQADVPFQQPKASDLNAQKSFADDSFSFKLGETGHKGAGAVGPEAARKGGGGAPPSDNKGTSDDGGGPNYPHRIVEYNGQKFPSVVFRPNVPIEPLLVQAIDSAQKTLRIALYEFKQRSVLEALYRAKSRGVDVQIILDYSNVFPYNGPQDTYQKKRSWEIWRLLKDGFNVSVLRGDGEFGIMHNKFVVVDDALAEFGSYNWSWAAEHAHYENANFTVEKKRVKALAAYWDYLRGLAQTPDKARDYKWPRQLPATPKTGMTVDFNGVKLPGIMLQPDAAFEDWLVKAIDASKKTVEVSMFAMRSTLVAEALGRAHKRGLKVRVIIDRSQHDSDAFGVYTQWLAAQGMEVRILAGPNPDSDFQVAEKDHNKIAIFDGKLVETGSPNYTKYAARNNFENGHFLDDATDVAGYQFHFEHMWKIAKVFAAPADVPALPSDEQLTKEVEKDPSPRPPVVRPVQKPLPPARELKFNGTAFPSSALLPEVPIEPLIIKGIDAAKKSLRLALYEFNLDGVLEALRRAKKRGVKIEIVLDRAHVYTTGKSHDRNGPKKPSEPIQALIAEGFDVLLLKGQGSGIQHNKFIIYDDKMVMSGSYNLTVWAERNHYENVTFSMEKPEVADMKAYFAYMRKLAEAVDHDKLDEILSRGASGLETTEPEAARKAADPLPEERDSKFPLPPASKAPPVVHNGESFARYYFSPQGGIEDALIRAIKAAKTTIDIAMFSFYSKPIADALLEAKERGVKVRLALDLSQSKMAKLDDWFAFHGFEIVLLSGPGDPEYDDDADPMFEKMHNKYMVVDGAMLATGSFNYSPNAENNSFEHVKFVDDPMDLARYAEEFARMFARGFKPTPPKKEPAFGKGAKSESFEDYAAY